MSKSFQLVIKGIAMGICEVIPGVSGGTIAFITGIYEELIDSIKNVHVFFLPKSTQEPRIRIWNALNISFLLPLLFGMVLGIIIGVFGVTYLLVHYPEPLWAFFFGLLLASVGILYKQVKPWNSKMIFALGSGAIVAFTLTQLTPLDGSFNLIYVYVSGFVAISALILPGISGSFILLVLGMYWPILSTVKNILSATSIDNIEILLVFILGCLSGLIVFSTTLSWLLKNKKQNTFSVLIGFIVGSLGKIWPWRNKIEVLNKIDGKTYIVENQQQWSTFDTVEIKTLKEAIVLPHQYWGESWFWTSILCMIIGGLLILFIEKMMFEQNKDGKSEFD